MIVKIVAAAGQGKKSAKKELISLRGLVQFSKTTFDHHL
jgi:hypothetical protein